MRTIRPLAIGLAAATAATAALPMVSSATAGPAPAAAVSRSDASLSAIGLTAGNRLVRFNTASPEDVTVIGEVSGLVGDTKLIGIDYRVQNDLLYGVGDRGGIYTLRTRDASANRVSQLTAPLDGTRFGVDFNPAADALRIISDTGQNLRHSLPTGTTTIDLPLSYTPPTPATGLTMAAYTNNDLDLDSGTTLFDIDTDLDQVAIQAPANNGTLSATGKLGVDVRPSGGFDAYSELDDDGRTERVWGYATMAPVDGSGFTLYRIRFLTGQADEVGDFPRRNKVNDIAIKLDQL